MSNIRSSVGSGIRSNLGSIIGSSVGSIIGNSMQCSIWNKYIYFTGISGEIDFTAEFRGQPLVYIIK